MTNNKITKIKVTLSDLDGYMNYVHQKKSPKKSLTEYIQKDNEQIIADLSGINWSKTKIDLSYGDFSGAILDNIDFNGKNIVIKGANLRGASLKGSKFTGQIDLAKVKFGSIQLRSEVFQSCQLAEAEYDLSTAKIMMLRVTDTQLDHYLALPNPKPNLNQHLEQTLGNQYHGLAIVADLSDKTINEKYNDADLSGSNLEHTTITGEITGLKLRDCFTHETKFKDCYLTEVDLRGTCLAEKGIFLSQNFKAATFEGKITLESPFLSIGDNTNLAREIGILPEYNTSMESMTLETDDLPILDIIGAPVFDPCYKKETINTNNIYKKFSRKDVEEYCKLVQKQEMGIIPSFNEFKHLKSNEIADFSDQNLKDLNFSNTSFDNCNFSFAQLNRSNFSKTRMNNCNFSGANFASNTIDPNYTRLAALEGNAKSLLKKIGIEYNTTSMAEANFNNCDFTWANLTGVNARNTTFNDVTAINLNAADLILDKGAAAHRTNFAGARLDRLQASRLIANGANFSHTQCQKANFQEASLNSSNFAHANCDDSDFTESKLNASNFFKSSLKSTKLIGSKINGSRINADISSAKINASMNNSDCSSMHHKENSTPTVEGVERPLADLNVSKYQEMQLQQEMVSNQKSSYNKYALFIIVATALVAIVMPIVIIHLAPALMTAAGAQAIISTGILTISAIAGDLAIEKMFGYSPWANKLMTNFFGEDSAKKINNQRTLENIHDLTNVRDVINNDRRQLQSCERDIIVASQSRYQQSQTQSNPVQKTDFVTKLFPNKGPKQTHAEQAKTTTSTATSSVKTK